MLIAHFYVYTIWTDVNKLLPILLLSLLTQLYMLQVKKGKRQIGYIIFNCFQLLHEILCVHAY